MKVTLMFVVVRCLGALMSGRTPSANFLGAEVLLDLLCILCAVCYAWDLASSITFA